MDTAERASEAAPEASKREAPCHEHKAGFGLEGPSLNDYSCVKRHHQHVPEDVLSGPSYAQSRKSSSGHLRSHYGKSSKTLAF